ncbi:MAG TPA: HPr family phosphocarrier protein [Clostridiaceae bacterium]|jgi:phosphocarrier protein HPr|nr:HPr family phosphocarrier protein [Clostridiaceae bacterium]
MITKEITIKNRTGLQSKSAAVFIHKATSFKSSIWIEKEERKANAKSLLGLLSLGISYASKVILTVEGEDEEIAAKELEDYLVSEMNDV